MTTLNEVGIQVGNTVEDCVHFFESDFVVSQSFLAHIRRIAHHRIESPVLLALRLIKEYLGEFEFPVEEALIPRKSQRSFYRSLIFLVGSAIIAGNNRTGI